ncbi:hypothetical protein PsYK624_150640 [Phanerochaete sordida]|uniref:Uncharacterized protein n=1 Tax=Phanerochaete sordida TaxID=48140 RepID=A0A9P3GNT7_9APHY|nr:hypothetical protein PsYK624_150640 [Phanerochaete sordida]
MTHRFLGLNRLAMPSYGTLPKRDRTAPSVILRSRLRAAASARQASHRRAPAPSTASQRMQRTRSTRAAAAPPRAHPPDGTLRRRFRRLGPRQAHVSIPHFCTIAIYTLFPRSSPSGRSPLPDPAPISFYSVALRAATSIRPICAAPPKAGP